MTIFSDDKPSISLIERCVGFNLVLNDSERDAWWESYLRLRKAFASDYRHRIKHYKTSELSRIDSLVEDLLKAIGLKDGEAIPLLGRGRQMPVDALLSLRDWVRRENKKVVVGNPTDVLSPRIISCLLILYWVGFGKKPPRSTDGPALRFVEAFICDYRTGSLPLRVWNQETRRVAIGDVPFKVPSVGGVAQRVKKEAEALQHARPEQIALWCRQELIPAPVLDDNPPETAIL